MLLNLGSSNQWTINGHGDDTVMHLLCYFVFTSGFREEFQNSKFRKNIVNEVGTKFHFYLLVSISADLF